MSKRAVKVGLALAAVLVAGSLRASGSAWQPVPSLKLRGIAALTKIDVFGIDGDSQLRRLDGDTWTVVAGAPPLKLVAGSVALLIGIDTGERLLRRSGDQWVSVNPPGEGPFIQGGVDSSLAIYLLEKSGALWRGTTVQGGEHYDWIRFDTGIPIIDISVSGDLIYAVDQEHRLLRRSNDTWSVDQTAPRLESVSAGGGLLFGLNGGEVFRRSGDTWSRVDGPPMRQVSVGADGTTYGLGPRPGSGLNSVWIYSAR